MEQLDKAYNPKVVEEKWYKYWEENGFFNAELNPDKKPYCIVMPPPNITGILHMGHALNNTIQDILIRFKRMNGFDALWMPGTDHAGIATQNVVERKLAKKNINRYDLGRERFVDEVWKWQNEYGGTIINQLKSLGASCDWRRERFTMDEGLSGAVLEVFIRLYNKGLIYSGNYIINWCPRCATALSDEESEHRELDGYLYYIRYPIKDSKDYVVVATTRPETMLGDVAVAVNPGDERYKWLAESRVILPVLNRELKVIQDDYVDMKFGTGVVKVTPAHDPNDFDMGKRHNLKPICVMNPDGTMNNETGSYEGMDRFEAREALLEDLKERKLIEKIEPHRYAVGHCYRCHTVVEPYLSKQWFVKMRPLAEPAIKAVEEGKIKFYPERWTKVYLEWMYNIRDWCISRQIWWGHRIPVYYCKSCQDFSSSNNKNKGIIVSKTKPEKCPDCGSEDIVQDPDVLDTWFSSWLWPFSTFGWPFLSDNKKDYEKQKKEFEYFYPTSALVTAQEIIFFWVARMIMAGFEFCGDLPFKEVYIHGTVRDDTGTKMSKSIGNVIDPIEIIDSYGTDALRFSLISLTAAGQDVFLSKDKFASGRNFANKIWNVSRFLLMNIEKQPSNDLCSFFEKENLSLADKWILSALYRTLDAVNRSFDSYKFNDGAKLLYDFIWHKYCDWYVEISKDTISKERTQLILFNVLEKSLRMLHPVMPFVTEEILQKLNFKESIMVSSWPDCNEQMRDAAAEQLMEKIISIVIAIRNIRADMNIDHKQEIDAVISLGSDIDKFFADELTLYSRRLAKINRLKVMKNAARPAHSASAVLDFCQIFVPLEGIVDIRNEKRRLMNKLSESEAQVNILSKKLSNETFVERAPKEIVEKEREKLIMFKDKTQKLKENIENLS